MGGGLRKVDGGKNIICILWFWCDKMIPPSPSYMTQVRGGGYGGVWMLSREVELTLKEGWLEDT